MKTYSLGILGLLAFCVLQGATALPKYAGSTTDWKQFLPAQKRAASPEGEDDVQVAPEELPPQQLSSNPMTPYLSLRPFLPVKPTFMPPFVDPQMFVDKKAAFLNTLFGNSGALQNPANSTAATSPLIWLPPASPNYFAQKKTEFLKTLFSSLAAQSIAPTSPQQAKRDLTDTNQVLVQSQLSSDSSSPTVGCNTCPSKKSDFLQKLFDVLNEDGTTEESSVTVKPTIVPLDFWAPPTASAATLARVPLKKTQPVMVDPSFFMDKKTKFLNTLFSNLAATPKTMGVPPTKASIVPPNYWIPPGKPDTATIYQQKVSEFLDKLFKSLNTTSGPAATNKRDVNSLLSEDGTEESDIHTTSLKPRFIGSPMSMWGPSAFAPTVNPKFFIDKKTEFLNKLFTSLSTPAATNEAVDPMNDPSITVKPTVVPPNFWSPFPSGGVSTIGGSPTVKPTIVPPNFWSPFASVAGKDINSDPSPSLDKPMAAIDPSVFINKKAQFLDSLFNSLDIPSKIDATTQAPTQTTSKTTEATVETSDTDNSVLAFLIERLILSADPGNNVSKRNNVHEEENTHSKDVSSEEDFGDSDNNLSTRSLKKTEDPVLSTSPLLVAKDKVANSIIAELGGIKNEMMTTVEEILKQKKDMAEQAAAVNPFSSYGMKSPYGFGGGKMFGAGMKGAGKKGETAAADGKKKMGAPYGGKFPFWAPTPATKPTPDPTAPLQERLDFLNQVFEMLTKLQEDVSSAVNEATIESTPQTTVSPLDENDVISILRKMIMQQKNSTKTGKNKLSPRDLSSEHNIHPATTNPLPPNVVPELINDDTKTRSIKMAVHQGYQSLPPGTEEIIETGGGSEVDNHEGGGLKLQIKVPV
ncbi:uncharacterized protein [Anabrus simplex]|uniref:uncharacterized protein isoform X2 n=1 Tax=Anabrus simplex TaxID=316456 RepID=UPI0035A38885